MGTLRACTYRPHERHANEVPFKELALEGVINALLAPHYYDFAAAAVAWLVGNSGRDLADLEYWRLLAKTDDSESAFAAAFGIASDDFVEAFESDRTTFADRLPQIGGLVVDLAGVPLAGVHIAVSPGWGAPSRSEPPAKMGRSPSRCFQSGSTSSAWGGWWAVLNSPACSTV